MASAVGWVGELHLLSLSVRVGCASVEEPEDEDEDRLVLGGGFRIMVQALAQDHVPEKLRLSGTEKRGF